MKSFKVEEYINHTDKYLTQGEKELKESDLRQAGEKYCGAVTQIIKAYCELKD